MTKPRKGTLHLGTGVVEEILPHGRPLLLVDRVLDFREGESPELVSCKYISANEPVFEGHFGQLHLWPGIFTQEGLGQSCYLLYWIVSARRRWAARSGDPDEVLKALENLDRGYRLRPGFDPDVARFLRAELRRDTLSLGLSSSVNLKYLKPVFAGCQLDYLVRLTHELQEQTRFEVQANVEGEPVAKGVMTARVDLDLPDPLVGR